MALAKVPLKAGIKAALLANLPSPTAEQTTAADTLAGAFADAIDTYVKTGTVAAGIPVSTTGTAVAQTGATTAPASIV